MARSIEIAAAAECHFGVRNRLEVQVPAGPPNNTGCVAGLNWS